MSIIQEQEQFRLLPVEAMNERDFCNETQVRKDASLNCPFCRTVEVYPLRWLERRRKKSLPPGANERDRARFQKFQDYMLLLDDRTQCKNPRCRRTFEISGIKSMAFLS